MLDVQSAYTYFNHHLARAEFMSFPPEEIQAALAMAENDVRALAPHAAPENFAYLCAVCEQALHLLRHQKAAAEPNPQSEQLDGIGSCTYGPDGRTPELSPRARKYVEMLQKILHLQVRRG